MKSTLFILSIILGGSIAFATSARAEDAPVEGFFNKMICAGNGTCYRDVEGTLRKACSGGSCVMTAADRYRSSANGFNPSMPASITTNAGNILIVPNQNGGIYPSAVINTSR
jgi:hypothetical protein